MGRTSDYTLRSRKHAARLLLDGMSHSDVINRLPRVEGRKLPTIRTLNQWRNDFLPSGAKVKRGRPSKVNMEDTKKILRALRSSNPADCGRDNSKGN
jgi:transposase